VFTEPRITPVREDSDHTETPPRSSSEEPSTEQEQQDEPALEEQLAEVHVQDNEEEEPLQYNDPPQPVVPQVQQAAPLQLPAPQQAAQPLAVMAQAPPVVTGKLKGEAPDTFTGDRTESEAFKQQFQVYWYMNPNNEIMRTPYYRVMQHLSLIKGPLVNDWKADQISDLVEKTTRAANPIGYDEDILWNEYIQTFNDAFTDTTKKQKAQSELKHLRMRDDDLDTYIARFKHLARDAGYDLTALGTADLFALGLRQKLFDASMYRDTQPETFDEWVTAAKAEQTKRARRYAMQESAYQSQAYHRKPYKAANGHRKYIHPNDRTVPMDIDQPTYTRIRRAYTEDDKKRLQDQGRCFYCEQQGHMARECPKKKRQQPQSGYRQTPSKYGQKPFQPRSGQFERKTYNQPKPRQGFRKSNKPRRPPFSSHARAAHIEEIVEEDEGNEDEDNDVASLAARTARLSENQREQWVQEMNDMGIHF
jgi:hypothetical protein